MNKTISMYFLESFWNIVQSGNSYDFYQKLLRLNVEKRIRFDIKYVLYSKRHLLKKFLGLQLIKGINIYLFALRNKWCVLELYIQ
mgnify:CR=1 FL=1